MVDFENKNVMVGSMNVCIPTNKGFIKGDNIFVDSTPNKDRKFNVPDGGIWMLNQNDTFQNKENFIQGVKYISELARPKSMKVCFDLLDWMTEHYESKNTMEYCRYLGFFCEVGVWKNPKVRQSSQYHKDFPKYLSNCMDMYLKKELYN